MHGRFSEIEGEFRTIVRGEQKEKYGRLSVVEQDQPFTEEELRERRRQLAHLSRYDVLDAYREAHRRCCMSGSSDGVPDARSIQELVCAWKLLRSWMKG